MIEKLDFIHVFVDFFFALMLFVFQREGYLPSKTRATTVFLSNHEGMLSPSQEHYHITGRLLC